MKLDAAAAAPQTIFLKDYTPPAFLIDKVDLTFELEDDHTRVLSRLVLHRNPAHPVANAPLRLDGDAPAAHGQAILDRLAEKGDLFAGALHAELIVK